MRAEYREGYSLDRRGFVVWFTGLSGAGKSTVSAELVRKLRERGEARVEVLDGDTVRTNLSKGLGFSKEDRDTNILRIGFVCELLARNGVIAVAAAISPYLEIRNRVRSQVKNFVEVFVSAPLETLIERDTKGLYKKAIAGEIKNFTGVSDPYEAPQAPEVLLETEKESIATSVDKVLRALELLGLLPDGKVNLSKEEEEKVKTQLRANGKLLSGQTVSISEKVEQRGKWSTIPPHGGVLVDRFLTADKIDAVAGRLEELPSLTLNARQWSDVELIANGGYSPLTGFVGSRDYQSIINAGRLSNGLAWTIPILLLVDRDEAKTKSKGGVLVLRGDGGKSAALLHVNEIYHVDKTELAQKVWGTTDPKHPGVKNLLSEGDTALAGDIEVVRLESGNEFGGYRLAPAGTRAYFTERGWKTVAAFQTRNPIHRAHEYLHKVALETVDGLLLHPLVGQTKDDDVPAEVRMECYKALLGSYYPGDRVLLSVLPAAMRYAGPKEAIHHAIMRQNYGCTHFIVGRDHAGVGGYYGTYDAQKIFDEYSRDELGILPLKFEHAFYCRECEGMASEKTCPHGTDSRIILSGSKVREMLRNNQDLPDEFSRPEVVRILKDYYSAA